MTLFDQDGAGLDPVYLRLRDTDDASDAEQKAYLDNLWTRARPHLDGNFKSAFARNTAQRFWELRLAVAFLDLGYALDAGGEGRPDLATRLSTGERLWVEAVAPTLGAPNNPDRPAELIPDGRFRPVPIEQILMRYTQVLREKRDQFLGYRQAGVVAEGDRCVIAVSSAALWPHVAGVGLPRILSAVFPIGNERVIVDRDTLAAVRVAHEYRGEVFRAGGAGIATTAFLTPDYAMISGVIHDSARPTGWRRQGYARLMSANNPTTTAPLPSGYFALGEEYRSGPDGDGFSLQRIEHRMDDASSLDHR
jgi:hypothetical protein